MKIQKSTFPLLWGLRSGGGGQGWGWGWGWHILQVVDS